MWSCVDVMFIVNKLNFVFFLLDLQYKITTDTEVGRNFVFKKAKETVRNSINKLVHNQMSMLFGCSIVKGFLAICTLFQFFIFPPFFCTMYFVFPLFITNDNVRFV